MRSKIFLAAIVLLIAFVSNAQTKNSPGVIPYFSAVIVKNLDTSVAWYQSVFDLKARTLTDVPAGFRVSILESSQFVMELIENNSWPDQKGLLGDQPEGTHIQGWFKIGFRLSDMDSFVARLKKMGISVNRIYKDSSNKRNFLINDPDGNLVQFFE